MKKADRAEKSQQFNKYPILGLLNFIYSLEVERKDLSKRSSNTSAESEKILDEIGHTFDDFAIWCSTKVKLDVYVITIKLWSNSLIR